MISKKLLNEVLGYELDYVENKSINSKVWYFEDKQKGFRNCINIYELAHKCKLWAFNEGYSFRVEMIGLTTWQILVEDMNDGSTCFAQDFYNSSESQAIFFVCEWILGQRI